MNGNARRTVFAPAKVNPRLELLARRADGMHEVWTTLVALDRGDRVTVELRPAGAGPRIEVVLDGEAHSPDVPADASNLAARGAACVLEHLAGAGEVSLRIEVEKRIPSRAGLGGGSSDAAAAALACADLLGADPDDPDLLERLGALGADVPFFLAARGTGFGLGEGRGERITPLALPSSLERRLVILTPAIECSTAEVYGAVDPDGLRGTRDAIDPLVPWTAPLEEARVSLANDLEGPALEIAPGLARIRRDLDAGGGSHFRLSGSGSSFFGLFPSRAEAEAFARGETVSRIARDHGLRSAFVARPRGAGVSLESA